MTSDILTLHSAAPLPEQTATIQQIPDWTLLDQGVYWQGEADGCAAAAVIDIVGVAGRNDYEACFLLMP